MGLLDVAMREQNSQATRPHQRERMERGVLFLLPSSPAPGWIPAAGWASAAQKRWGNAWIMTSKGLLTPEQTLAAATSRRGQTLRERAGVNLPPTLGTMKKDLINLLRSVRFRKAGLRGPWELADLAFVWQRHELFQSPGRIAARHFGKPLVLFVDAPVVWEAKKWGVNRPGWANLVEEFGEASQLRKSDLVCCVSEEVAEKVRCMGVLEHRILVTPNAVDTITFSPRLSVEELRRQWGIEGYFVVGWVGSFRRFHGVDLILRAVSRLQQSVPNIALLLVGDGNEKRSLQRLSSDLGLRKVIFTGTLPYNSMPNCINVMDVAVVSAGTGDFHYSPLKLQEYMACGRAIIASRSGQVMRTLRHGVDALMIEPMDVEELRTALQRLYESPVLRSRLGKAARDHVVQAGGWMQQLYRVERKLDQLEYRL